MQKRHDTKKIALCGVFGALALLILLTGNVFSLAVYVCPALAGMLILPVADEVGARAGLLFYAGLSLLSLFILPDREPAILFIAFLGYYPLLKFVLERIRLRPLRLLCKLVLFNSTVLGAYWLMLHLFGFETLAQDMAELTGPLLWGTLILANVTFLLYDLAVGRLHAVYLKVLLPRIRKGRR